MHDWEAAVHQFTATAVEYMERNGDCIEEQEEGGGEGHGCDQKTKNQEPGLQNLSAAVAERPCCSVSTS